MALIEYGADMDCGLNDKIMTNTDKFLGLQVLQWAGWELLMFANDRFITDRNDPEQRRKYLQDTLSERIWFWCNKSRFILFGLSFLCGHLLGQSDDFATEKRFKDWLNSKPILIAVCGFALGRWLWQKIHDEVTDG